MKNSVGLLYPPSAEAYSSAVMVHHAKTKIEQDKKRIKQETHRAKKRLANDKSILERMKIQGGKSNAENSVTAIFSNPLILGGLAIMLIFLLVRK